MPPPVFLISHGEGPTGFTGKQLTQLINDAQLPNVNCYAKVSFGDAFANNFTSLDSQYAYFVPGVMLHIEFSAYPLPPAGSRTNSWQTITLSIGLTGQTPPVPLEIPVLWSPGFTTDFSTAIGNLKAHCVAKGYPLFSLNFCPSQRYIFDGEFQVPSTSGAPDNLDYTSNWLAITPGGTEAAFESLVNNALATIATAAGSNFPNVSFCWLVAAHQQLGQLNDNNATFATNAATAMRNAVLAAGSTWAMTQQSYSPTTPLNNFAVGLGLTWNNLHLQLTPATNTTPDINAAVSSVLGLGPVVTQLQVHNGTTAQVLAALAAPPSAGIVSYGGLIIRTPHQGIIVYA